MSVFDSFALSGTPLDKVTNDDYAKVDSRLGIFAVADGIGGRPGGAQASRVAVETLFSQLMPLPASQRHDGRVLRDAVLAANGEVHAVSQNDPELSGLGTTLSAVVCNGPKGKLVHVGDSRVYLFRDQILVPLTKDHTVVAELVEQERISPASAKRHPLRNML